MSNGRKIQKDLINSLHSFCDLNSTILSDNRTILTHIKDVSLALQEQASEYNVWYMSIGFSFLGASLLLVFVELKMIIRDVQCTFGLVDVCGLISVILHWTSLISTSFIEEEHQVWYFSVTTTMLLVLIGSINESLKLPSRSASPYEESQLKDTEESLSNMKTDTTNRTCENAFKIFVLILSLLIVFRIVRAWNQTGIKWLASSDISDYLLLPANKNIFVAIMVSSSLITTIFFYYQSANATEQIIFATGMFCVVIQKLDTHLHTESILSIDGTSSAQLVYVLCIVCSVRRFIIWQSNSFTGRCLKSLPSLLFTKDQHGIDNQHGASGNRNIPSKNLFTEDRDDIVREKDFCTQSHQVKGDSNTDSSLKLIFVLLYMNVLRPHNIIWFGMLLIVERATSEAMKR